MKITFSSPVREMGSGKYIVCPIRDDLIFTVADNGDTIGEGRGASPQEALEDAKKRVRKAGYTYE